MFRHKSCATGAVRELTCAPSYKPQRITRCRIDNIRETTSDFDNMGNPLTLENVPLIQLARWSIKIDIRHPPQAFGTFVRDNHDGCPRSEVKVDVAYLVDC